MDLVCRSSGGKPEKLYIFDFRSNELPNDSDSSLKVAQGENVEWMTYGQISFHRKGDNCQD